MDGVTAIAGAVVIASNTTPISNDVGEKDDKARIASDSRGSGDTVPTNNDVGENDDKARIASG